MVKILFFVFLASLSLGTFAQSKALPKTEKAIIAAGCFWGVEEYYRKLPGVLSTEVGYTGGKTSNPKYDEMHDGKSGHAESMEIVFNPAIISYTEILNHFFKFHDPTTKDRQGNDKGNQYRSALFYLSDKQKNEALAFKAKVDKSKAWKNPVVTEIVPASKFWKAEEYHQDYLVKNPGGYDNHYVRQISFDLKGK